MKHTIIKKVTKSGKNTFAISIPINFIRENNLKIGDTLEVSLKKLNDL
jgi:antitoxin component of MazEF toxin-antitoxin module